ncbi:MAG: hypothetical protein WA957_09615 [Alteraurantiacibacter sp.]
MTYDPFSATGDSVIAPSRFTFAVVPDDIAKLDAVTKAIYVGIGGDVVVRSIDADADVTFRNVQAGTILDVRCAHVRATGTTAAGIVGLA